LAGLSGNFNGSVKDMGGFSNLTNITMGNPTTLPTIPGVIGSSGMNDTPAYIVHNRMIKL
jgi:hypothetical protein